MNLAWTTNPVWLVINALVAYRLTRLWISDSLPPLPMLRSRIQETLTNRWDIRTIKERGRLGVSTWEFTRREQVYPDHPLLRLTDCYWCAGFHISLGTVLAASLIPSTVWTLIALPLTLSAVVGLLGTRD